MAGAPGSADGVDALIDPVLRSLRLCLLGPDEEMDQAVRGRDEEAVEIFPQLFDFIPSRDAVHLEKRRRCLRIVCFQFQPNVGMTQVGHAVDPKPVRPKLKNAAVLFFLDQRQPQRITIKGNRLLVRVAWTLDGDVCAA